MENISDKITNKSVTKSIWLGVSLLKISIITQIILIEFLETFWQITICSFLLGVVLPFVILLTFIHDLRNSLGGYWTFRQAIKGIFILMLISNFINYVGKNFIYNLIISPGSNVEAKTKIINATTVFMQDNHVNPAEIKNKTNEIKEQFDSMLIFSLEKNIIYILLGSVLLSFVYRKKPFLPVIEEFG